MEPRVIISDTGNNRRNRFWLTILIFFVYRCRRPINRHNFHSHPRLMQSFHSARWNVGTSLCDAGNIHICMYIHAILFKSKETSYAPLAFALTRWLPRHRIWVIVKFPSGSCHPHVGDDLGKISKRQENVWTVFGEKMSFWEILNFG